MFLKIADATNQGPPVSGATKRNLAAVQRVADSLCVHCAPNVSMKTNIAVNGKEKKCNSI